MLEGVLRRGLREPGFFLVLSVGKPPMPIQFLLLGGGVGFLDKGGVEVPILFLRGDFSEKWEIQI